MKTTSNYLKHFLFFSFFALFFGSLYTLARKFQNLQQAPLPNETLAYYHQPLYQVFTLFIGMFLALPFKLIFNSNKKNEHQYELIIDKPKKRDYNIFLLIFPSTCDVFATILDCIGLIYTHVSVHQMLKGFMVIFTFLISIMIFKKQYKLYHYIAVLFILLGCAQVGHSNIDHFSAISAPNPLLGNILCICGQLLLSFMFIYEEYILKDYQIEILDIVGWEGFWGSILAGFLLIISFFIPNVIVGFSDNFLVASYQIIHSKYLFIGVLAGAFSIGPFNYFGTHLTKIASASHRSTICSMRMFTVWMISLLIGWEQYCPQQLYGYLMMTFGVLMYNDAFNFDFNFEVKPTFPYSLKVFENIIVLKQQFKNFKNLLVKPTTLDKNSQNKKGLKGKFADDKESQKKNELNANSLDNSNESDSLTIEEILDTLMEKEKQENTTRKKD